MYPFLKDIAQRIITEQKNLGGLTIVFPNRRAALFFQKYLAESLTNPSWSPKMLSIESLFSSLSELREPDRLSLIYRLYKVYQEVMKNEEPFDRFYFWGDMLLRDFDEVDKYLVNAQLLFKDLSKLKELDESFDFLTDEQKEFLKGFWVSFEEKPTGSKEEFLKVWRKLPKVYTEFTKSLKKEKLGYEGMIHREVAERVAKQNLLAKGEKGTDYIFAGFNALTRSEELVLGYFVGEGAKVYWDTDAYYVNDEAQEAGQFFRQYKKQSALAQTFEPAAEHFKTSKEIRLTGVPQRIGQAKLVGQRLSENLPPAHEAEKTVIVLPDESMLLPVLHSLPPELSDVNVTMGYPLRNTPLYNLLDLLIEMQLQRKGNYFSHRQVTAILGHAYIVAIAKDEAQKIRNSIISSNRVFISVEELQLEDTLLHMLFQEKEPGEASVYLLEIVKRLGASFTDRQSFDREYAFHFHRHLARLHEVLDDSGKHPDWRGFQKLFRQVVLTQKIPFTGEPLKGLQVMGVLETRNLDFDNVFVLSLNEGMLPSAARQGSYIPNSIRKAYRLPTHEHQDAIYAYLFYRLLQRAKNIQLYYNTEPDIIGNGEMSRFVQQLIYESGLSIDHYVLHNAVQINAIHPVSVAKTKETLTLLEKYLTGSEPELQRELTPSALNDYIECRLRFYLKHLARLREADEVEEDLDARIFGNLLHDVVFWFYDELASKTNGEIREDAFADADSLVTQLIDKAFIELYRLDPAKEVTYEGQRIVVRTIVQEFMSKIVERDKAYAPFIIEALEKKFAVPFAAGDKNILLGGKIDRVDRKGEAVRVIDYKTGKDELGVESIESLFDREGKRNKAAFQTMLYAYLYAKEADDSRGRMVPGLMNRKNLFEASFVFGHPLGRGRDKQLIEDARLHFPEFENHLRAILTELYNPDVPFDQTSNLKSCLFCSYKGICRR